MNPLILGTVVLELYTSQGCSSCPPADALLSELAADPEVIALSFHVDYWDSLGWKDAWSSPEWTNRQRRAAASLDGRVYTPELVVNGTKSFVGSSRSQAESAIAAAKKRKAAADVSLAVTPRKDGGWTVAATVTPSPGAHARWIVEALLVDSDLVTKVRAGENEGRTIRNDGVVRRLAIVGEIPAKGAGAWTGAATLSSPGPATGPRRIAVLVRDAETLEIAGAAISPL